jgi:predicted nucleic acid-binding protein
VAQVFIDTGAVYALIDGDDANHRAARRTLKTLKKRRLEPCLTNFVVAESHALLVARLDAALARRWLLGNVWRVERVNEEDESRARAIIAQYADKRFTYTDATSFAVMERLGLKTAFAFDAHFRQYGFQVIGLAP